MGYTLAVIGCGTMGHAILSGIFTRLPGDDLPSKFIATVGRETSIAPLKESFTSTQEISFKFGDEGNVEAIRQADMVLLACKPYMAKTILQKPGVKDALKGKVLASVLAGVTMSQLCEWAGEECEVVRTMTNTPSKIGAGMTLLTPTTNSSTSQRLQAIFSSCGRVLTVPETQFNACTALAGSGPAFVAVMVDALADGAVLMGLPRKAAVEMAAQTLMGTAQMILETGVHPAALKDGVTSTFPLSSQSRSLTPFPPLSYSRLDSLAVTQLHLLASPHASLPHDTPSPPRHCAFVATLVLSPAPRCRFIRPSRSLPLVRHVPAPFLRLGTAPGGCTIAGLMRMEDGNIRSTLARTIEAATLHAAGLGQEKK